MLLCYNYYIIRDKEKIYMEKIFKTDNGEIKFESKNGSIKISQGENFMIKHILKSLTGN